jgi:acetoin utilization protein AcuB
MLIHEIMSKNPFTIIMADNKIGGLPVVRDGKLVGLITESDLFKFFIKMLGTGHTGARLSMLVPKQLGTLADVVRTIASMGGSIISLSTFPADDAANNRLIIVKVANVSKESLAARMKPLALEILDSRNCDAVG